MTRMHQSHIKEVDKVITFNIVLECTSSLRDEPRCQSSEKPSSSRQERADTPKPMPSKRLILRSHASTVQSNHDFEAT